MTSTMHRQVRLLAAAQALFQTASVLVMTVGALAGSQIAPAPHLATAPIAAMFLGTAIATFPASLWMAKAGRRRGFVAGALLGVLGGLVAAAGIARGSLVLLCVGTLLVGGYQGFAQFYRFAASEVASEAFRPRAISFVLAGGVVAALAGPVLARVGGPLLEPAYTGSFLILAVTGVIAAGILSRIDFAATTAATGPAGTARPLATIVRQPAYAVALFGAATGYGIMILAMTATPLAMRGHHHDLAATATVIQLHVLGMFLPSFVTGSLIGRYGVLPVMGSGLLLFLGHILLALSGTGFASYASALILLGVGWNFLYVGGTSLLTKTYSTAERGRAQAANDMAIFAVGLAGSLGAGALLDVVGWQVMNLIMLPWIAVAGAALLWLGIKGSPGPVAIGRRS